MNNLSIFKSRYSCRFYKNKPVNKDLLTEVFTNAIQAPSWCNSQPWEVFVASGETLNKLRFRYLEGLENKISMHSDIPVPQKWPNHMQERMHKFHVERESVFNTNGDTKNYNYENIKNNINFFNAPVVAFLCIDSSLSEWSLLDLGQLSQSILLATKACGLDSAPTYSSVVYPQFIRDVLKIPNELKIVIGIEIGYGDDESIENKYKSSRVPLDEVVHFK